VRKGAHFSRVPRSSDCDSLVKERSPRHTERSDRSRRKTRSYHPRRRCAFASPAAHCREQNRGLARNNAAHFSIFYILRVSRLTRFSRTKRLTTRTPACWP